MDAVVAPGVEEVGFLKAAQLGWSDSIERNLFGYWIDRDPGPLMVLFPDQKSAEDYQAERLMPLLRNTPALAEHMSSRAYDATKHRVRLDTMPVYFAWGGSSASQKSRPIRYLSVQEPDDMPLHSGSGGGPIDKARKRLTTYMDKGMARVVIGGTPTTRAATMWRWWEACGDKRWYWVPCPLCRRYQRLTFGTAGEGPGLKWKADSKDRVRASAEIAASRNAWYQCEHCKGRILDHHKPGMLRGGAWAGEDQAVVDGRIVGDARESGKVGFQLSALYSPWVSFASMASEWLLAQDDPGALMDFVNQRLAEPFEEQRAKLREADVMARRDATLPTGIVPAWVFPSGALIATADTQGADEPSGYFYFAVRAWAPGYKSHLVAHGVAKDKRDLLAATIHRRYRTSDGKEVAPQALLIDSGGPRWNEVYEFALSDAQRIKPCKGANTALRWMVRHAFQKAHGVTLWEIDTTQSKDLLHRLAHGGGNLWTVHGGIDDEYCRQMTAEAKILDPKTGAERWVEVAKNSNHFWDCEAMQCAAAYSLGLGAADDGRDAGYTVPAPQAREPERPRNFVTEHRGKW